MADSRQDPAKLHAAVASTGTTLNGEDFDSKTPVPSLGGEKDDLDLGVDEKQQESVVESPAEDAELREDEYPSGIKMFFIVLALVLSVFLLSSRLFPDHCCNSHPQNHRRVPRSRQGRLVRCRLLHDRWRIPVNM